jgi:hypothetical protein
MPEPSIATQQLLPTSREALRSLFEECEQCLKSAERSHYRNTRLLDCLSRLDGSDYSFSDFLKDRDAIYENSDREKNNYQPSAEHVLQYCDAGLLVTFQSLCSVGAPAVVLELQKPITNAADAEELKTAFVSYACSRNLKVHLLRELRDRVGTALAHSDTAKGADTSADISKILAKIEPKNSDITALFRFLSRNEGSGESQMSLAVQFTQGKVTRAKSLLRGVRRYVRRLNQALNDDSK